MWCTRCARRVGGGRVDDPMKVVADRGEGVLRGFTLQIAQLVYAAALHRRAGPHQTDGAAEPGIAVDDAEQGAGQPARFEVVQAAFPRCERFASAKIEGQESSLSHCDSPSHSSRS